MSRHTPQTIWCGTFPPQFPGGVAPKFGSEKVSRYTGVSQVQLRVSRYTVQLSFLGMEGSVSKNLLMGLFLIGCFGGDFQDRKRPFRIKSGKRPQNGLENWCCAEIVEKCRKTLLTPFDDFWRFLPCAKNVEKCQRYFWRLLTLFDASPFCGPLNFIAKRPPLRSENGPLRRGNAPLSLMGCFRAPLPWWKRLL